MDRQEFLTRIAPNLSPKKLSTLALILAPTSPPKEPYGSGTIGSVNRRADIVNRLLGLLATNPSHTAHNELVRLSYSIQMKEWSIHVEHAIRTQHAKAREASFEPASPSSAALTLANLEPANSADLQALIIQDLNDVEAESKGSNTFLVRQFWSTEKPIKPRDENYCRDVLKDKLDAKLLRNHVFLEREGSAANDKRADMRANFMRNGRRIAVPIEVKKDNHRELWTAWDEQLKRLYTNDPDSGGFGIYLVLWFGHKTKTSPEGVIPASAAELQELLVQRIPAEERVRLAVKVMDLSLPAG